MKKAIFLLVFLIGMVQAQETFPVNGVQDNRAQAYAFTNATIFTDYQTRQEGATLLIREGKVEKAGQNITIPEGYRVIDLKGRFIYPAFIDMHTSYGMPEEKKERGGRRGFGPEIIAPATDGAYNANDAIKAQNNASELFKYNEKDAKTLRELGFATVQTLHADGLARGSSALVSLGEDTENRLMFAARSAAEYSFRKGSSTQTYPISPMGFIAVLRQTWLDAQWYAQQNPKPFTDQTLDALLAMNDLPQIFETNGWRELLRADKLGDEFSKQFIIKTAGDEYQRLTEVKATGAPLIVGLNFPEAFDVNDPQDALRISLAEMKHWELAPTNAAALEKAGITFALTTDGLGRKLDKSFWPNLRKAIKSGLSEAAALRALTQTPAQLLGMADRLGKLAPGAVANFLITSGNIFDEESQIHENWIQGHPYRFSKYNQPDHSGMYSLTLGETSYQLTVSGKPGKHKLAIANPAATTEETADQPEVKSEEPAEEKTEESAEEKAEEKAEESAEKTDDGDGGEKKAPGKSKEITVESSFQDSWVSLSFAPSPKEGAIRLSGWIEDQNWRGTGVLADGTEVSWNASYTGALEKKEGKDGEKEGKGEGKGKKGPKADEKAEPGSVVFPFSAYGSEKLPVAEDLLVQGATVWTNEADGVQEQTDVLIKNGKIAQVGKNLNADGARVIDGSGKHLTPGIIDEHTHIALDGTNDVATNSGMVRMMDVVDSEDINIYRQLAGGVVAGQLLHGSANPVGGQSALIKYRWGQSPEELLIKGADGFIKFALGENVKRSRSEESTRYPLTRMGVEQVYVDAFTNALEYEKRWQAYNKLADKVKATTPAPRRDLVQECMLDILQGKRFITCHSYVQSEINMLMKVAEKFGFKVNTFTHILEGYKVADLMAEHGVGGSTFADWWAYKWEVRYAIPYNAALMNNAGVVVAINSDDAEMARRLNQEAAKAVKYGGISEEDALKMVTLNPAKLLHLDNRMGSVKVGKDADLVLWNDHPLSIYARPEITMIDGTIYFSLERDAELRKQIAAERARLVKKMKGEGKKGGRHPGGMKPEMSCDYLGFAFDLETEENHETH